MEYEFYDGLDDEEDDFDEEGKEKIEPKSNPNVEVSISVKDGSQLQIDFEKFVLGFD